MRVDKAAGARTVDWGGGEYERTALVLSLRRGCSLTPLRCAPANAWLTWDAEPAVRRCSPPRRAHTSLLWTRHLAYSV